MGKKWFESLDINGDTGWYSRKWIFVNIDTGCILRPKYTTSRHPYHDIPAIECELNGKSYCIWLGERIKQSESNGFSDRRDSATQALEKAQERLLEMIDELNGTEVQNG